MSMFRFLSRAIACRRHIINANSPSTTFQNLLSAQIQWLSVRYATSAASNNAHSFTFSSYLIDTCGFSPQDAEAVSKRVSFETRDKPDVVINFLKTQGFSRSQILRFISNDPEFLRYDPHKTFVPKIEFLKSQGVSSSLIPRLVCSCPNIMGRSLSKQLIPSFHFFRDLFQSDKRLIKALTYCSSILLCVNTRVLPNVKLLREEGVPESNIIKLLQFFPRTLTRKPVRFKDVVEEVKEIEIDPLKFQFLMAVRVCVSISKSTRAKKASVYKKWGWSDNDIVAAFRKYPFCMTVSEDKIDAIMEFLVLKLGYDSSIINRCPSVLGLSLQRRILPRGAVIHVLLSKGLMKGKTSLSIFKYSEIYFLRKFLVYHGQKASGLLDLYQSKLDLAMRKNN